jgi:hypothetical protein
MSTSGRRQIIQLPFVSSLNRKSVAVATTGLIFIFGGMVAGAPTTKSSTREASIDRTTDRRITVINTCDPDCSTCYQLHPFWTQRSEQAMTFIAFGSPVKAIT